MNYISLDLEDVSYVKSLRRRSLFEFLSYKIPMLFHVILMFRQNNDFSLWNKRLKITGSNDWKNCYCIRVIDMKSNLFQ